jgi:hypothetical protein
MKTQILIYVKKGIDYVKANKESFSVGFLVGFLIGTIL